MIYLKLYENNNKLHASHGYTNYTVSFIVLNTLYLIHGYIECGREGGVQDLRKNKVKKLRLEFELLFQPFLCMNNDSGLTTLKFCD